MTRHDTYHDLHRLADEGEAVLAARDEQARLEKEAEELTRKQSWDALRALVAEKLAPLLPLLPEWHPEGFLEWVDDDLAGTFLWAPKPFGAVPLTVHLLQTGGAWTCAARYSGYGRPDERFLDVPTRYEPSWQSDGPPEEGRWVPAQRFDERTADLAEALALCRRAEKLYAACLEECRTKPAPAHLRQSPDPEPPPSAVALNLLAALDAYLAYR